MKTLSLPFLLLLGLFAGAQSINVTYPDATRPVWKPGFNQTLTWNTTGTVSNVLILRYQFINGVYVVDTIANNIPNTGSYVWNVTGNPGTQSAIRVQDVIPGPGLWLSGLYTVGPIIRASAGNTLSFCPGDTMHLFCSAVFDEGLPVVGMPALPLTYSWTPAGTLSDPDSSFTIAQPTVATNYIVNVTDGTYTGADTVYTYLKSPVVSITNTGNGIMPDTLVANVTGFGGCPTHTYTWNTGATTASIVAVTAGNYAVTVSNNCGCSATAGISVSTTPALTIIDPTSGDNYFVGNMINLQWGNWGYLPKVKIEFYKSNTGTWATLADSAVNTGSFTFQAPAVPAVIQARFRISDPYNSAVNDETNGTFNIVPVTLRWHCCVPGDTTICFGNSIVMGNMAEGGTPPYTYQWAASPDISNLNIAQPAFTPSADTVIYNVTVTDNTGGTITGMVIVNTVPDLTNTITFFTINGSCTQPGRIVIQAGGVEPVTYLWSNGSTDQHPTNLAAGTYTLTVTDAHGCQGVAATSVATPQALEVAFLSANNGLTCNQSSFGAMPGNAAVSPYNFIWSNGNTTNGQGNVPAGVYSVTITDATGCSGTGSIVKPTCSAMQVTTTAQSPTCFGLSNGSITATAVNGTPPYQYSINGGATWQSSGTFTNLPSGKYFIAAKDVNDTFDIVLQWLYDQSAAEVVISQSNQAGGVPNTLTAHVWGTCTPFQYSWSTGASTQNIVVSTGGVYTVTASNNCGCSGTALVNVSNLAVSVTNAINVTCNGLSNGSITVTGSGGTSPYVYSIDGGANWQSSGTFTGLAAGTYVVWVQDALGNTSSVNATVLQPTALQVTYTLPSDGAYPDTLTITATGGTPPYNYQPVPASWITFPYITQPGIYAFAVIDANGCGIVDSATTTNNTPSITVVYPNGGETLVVGQSLPLTWNNTGNIPKVKIEVYSSIAFNWITVEDSVINTNTYAFTVPNVPNTTGKVRISDPYNATVNDESDALFSIVAAGTFSVNVSSSDVICNGLSNGSISILAGNGTAPYQYSIDGGVTLVSTNTFGNLSPGAYNIVVKDATNTYVYQQRVITEPAPIVLVLGINSDGTYPDTVTTSASGGTPPYTYQPVAASWVTFPVINQPGTYSVAVSDINGCTTVDSVNTNCNGICVWPGDANYDGTVDNNDLLPIGLAYGTTGPTRIQQDNNWYGHAAIEWNDTLADGTNYMHSDCNGEGVINADDTLAILLNYNLNHPRSGMDEPRGGVPMLRVQMVPDTLVDGQTVIAHLLLGDSLNTATNVYGLAFTFNYDVDVVDSTEVSIQFNNNSWLCNNAQDHIDIDKKFYGPGIIKTALTRIDQTTRSGNGEIGNVSLKITTGNINGKNLAYYAMHCYITDLVVIDNNGNYLAVDPGLDSATIEYEVTGISQLSINTGVGIYPNPTTGLLNINSKNSPIQQYTITNLLGEVMLQSTTEATQQTTINTAALAQGVYVIRIQAGNQEFTGRFTKQ